MNLKDLIDQDKLRQSLKDILIKNPDTSDNISHKMGITRLTLMKFLNGGKCDFKRASLIDKWVKERI